MSKIHCEDSFLNVLRIENKGARKATITLVNRTGMGADEKEEADVADRKRKTKIRRADEGRSDNILDS